MKTHLLILALAVLCIGAIPPVLAQANPYMNAGEVTAADVPVAITSDDIAASDTSGVVFDGAGYTHTIGRVTIAMTPRISGLGADVKTERDGNIRRYGSDPAIEYELYRDLIKERITLKSPDTVSYSYDLRLSDWVTDEPDESRPEETPGANNTVITTYPHTVRVTNYAKDSTIDINPDRWGNLVVDVNGEDVVVMPKPYAIDATGKKFGMAFDLDKNAKTIAITGDLAGAEYPITIDPTERVTNGGFEAGDKSGWSTVVGNTNYYTVKSDSPYQGTYYLDVIGTGGYSGVRQTINYTNVSTVSQAVKIPGYNTYDIVFSNIWYYYGSWVINWPAQTAHDWQVRSTVPNLTGESTYDLWTFAWTHGHVDSVSALDIPPVANFTGTPTSGYKPLTVKFTDSSTNLPTSWSWDFGDGDSTNATVQNPIHTYDSAGTYTVELTATNVAGSDSEEKVDYITATPYYVYAEAGETDEVYTIAKGFWDQMIIAENGDIEWDDWQGSNDIIPSANARESHWTTNDGQYVEKSDFAYFSGHGAPNEIRFAVPDEGSGLSSANASRIRLGNGRTKWAVLDSCDSLSENYWTNWQQSFTGLHMLLGMNTSTTPSFYNGDGRGEVFARLMTNDYYPFNTTPLKIVDAWDWAGKYTWPSEPGHSSFDVFTGVVYDTNCLDDYLPGWGSSCTATSGSQSYQTTLVFAQYQSSGKIKEGYRSFELNNGKYSLSGSVPAEDTITVYSSEKPEYTGYWVDSLAKKLGMSGKASETGDAFYANGADAENNYFVVQKDAPVISFQKFDARSGFPQSRDESVSTANAFLKENGLMSDDMLEPGIAYNRGESLTKSGERKDDWRTAVITYSRELDGLPVWNSQKMVELDSKGNVIGYFQNWRDYEPYKEFKLKSPEKAFEEFQTKQVPSKKGSPDKIVVTDVLLGYYSQPAVAKETYLQPIYVFEGYLQYGDSIEPFAPVSISATDEVFDEIP